MKLSISNIAWGTQDDATMLPFLKEEGFQGLEIAPTRIFPNNPYDHIDEAREWAMKMKEDYNLLVSSMQSIWYGHSEKIFGSNSERNILLDYTRKAIDFAEAIECHNLVFGCPRNRETENIKRDYPIAIDFFKRIGDYAMEHNTVVALEPNPVIYNTHFMNYTEQAVEIVDKVSSEGIKVNYDLGTVIYNKEDVSYLESIIEYVNHVHISEPYLKMIEKREDIHKHIISVVSKMIPDKFVSIEMGKTDLTQDVKSVINYIKSCSE